MRYALLLAAVLSLALPRSGHGCGMDPRLAELAHLAVSSDSRTAAEAIIALRDTGPEGLDALWFVHRAMLKTYTDPQTAEQADLKDPAWLRLRAALDLVGGQHDCHASRLYWYTDLEQAKAAARAEHKPILSLRLLGNLTDEFSCANSRFFRTTLYSNAEVSAALRDRFILHWKSVRPVPKVTIDFGDGRKIERTLTGNSIHYVLDADGQPVDALPGLYGPKAFLDGIERAEKIALVPAGERREKLIAFHAERLSAIKADWRQDLENLGIRVGEQRAQAANAEPGRQVAGRVAAVRAAAVAVSKGDVEVPIIKAIADDRAEARALEQATDEDVWNRIAQFHTGDAQLDAASVALIASQHPTAGKAAPRAITKMRVESPLVRMMRNLQGAIALDTVRNEYLLHRQIHQWFIEGRGTDNVDALNEQVYAELFLTPSSDPWLGLVPRDTYTALENNGLTQDTAEGGTPMQSGRGGRMAETGGPVE